MSQLISAAAITKKILGKENLFILDVRNEEAFQDWKIEGETVTHLNVPYFDLLDGVEDIQHQLPKDRQILVVCAKQGSSEMIADFLEEAGFEDVVVLEGGMKTWSEYLHPVKLGDLKDGGSIYQFVRIGKGCLSYYIESNGEVLIIDPVRMTDAYKDFARERNAEIKYVMDTHLHADHISGGRLLQQETGAAYFLPPKDADEVQFAFESLEEGNDVLVGNTKVQAQPLYSPGHTIGSTSIIVDETYLMTGDILFVESIGRPDLAGKAEDWVGDLRETLYNRYKQLAQDLVVLPAHFGSNKEMNDKGQVFAKLGELYQVNDGLNIKDETEFRRAVTENLPPQPNSYQEIRHTNMGKITPEKEEQREMEIGPNRCAISG